MMNHFRVFVLGLLAVIFCKGHMAFAQSSVGLQSGNVFLATPYNGQITVVCAGADETETAVFNCRRSELSPRDTDHFIGPVGVPGDRVVLRARSTNGTERVKRQEYDDRVGRTERRIDLWTLTLTRRPLLDVGLNVINFEIFSGKVPTAQGEFAVQVNIAPAKTCDSKTYFSTVPADCNNSLNMCDRFFDEEPICY